MYYRITKITYSYHHLQAFITCSWGVENIGYVLMCYGTAASISSFVFGYLIKKIGRIPIFVLGFIISLTLLLVMQFVWHPDPSKPEFYFIVSAFWGSTNAIWTTQLSSNFFFFLNYEWLDNANWASLQHFMEFYLE